MKYFLAGTWVNDSTISVLPLGATLLNDAEWNNRNSTPYVPTLPEAKATKLASLEASRKQAIDNLPPVTVAGKQYPATPDFSREMSSIARRLAAGKPAPATLRDVDGASAPLNAVIIGQIDDAIATAVIAIRDRYWSRYDAVQVAATVAAIELVVW